MTRARDSLIFATIELMRRRGAAAGLADIVAASGRSRRTVYLNFPDGKGQMLSAATEFAGDAMNDMLAAVAEVHPPEQLLRMFIAGWVAILTDSEFESGCPVLAGALARHDAPDAADAAGAAFVKWAGTLTEAMERSGIDRATAEEVAVSAIAGVEGAVVLSQASRSVDPLHQVERSLLRLLRAARVEATGAQGE